MHYLGIPRPAQSIIANKIWLSISGKFQWKFVLCEYYSHVLFLYLIVYYIYNAQIREGACTGSTRSEERAYETTL